MTDITGTKYPAVGRCIYCGASGPEVRLTEEHIVAFALGGNVVLPEASCVPCATITGGVEQKVLRGGLRGIRERLGLPSRRKDRPKKLPLFCINGDETKRANVEIADYPATVILPHLLGPQIAGFRGRPVIQRPPWLFLPQPDMDTLASKYGIRQFASNSIDSYAFGRMLAKIAHAGAVAVVGAEKYVPFLNDVILHDRDDQFLKFVGSIEGTVTKPVEGDITHQWKFVRESADGRHFLTCHLRLFSNLGAPEYRIVVGQLKSDFDPLAVLPSSAVESDKRSANWRYMLSTSDVSDSSFTPISPHGFFTVKEG